MFLQIYKLVRYHITNYQFRTVSRFSYRLRAVFPIRCIISDSLRIRSQKKEIENSSPQHQNETDANIVFAPATFYGGRWKEKDIALFNDPVLRTPETYYEKSLAFMASYELLVGV